MWVAINGQADCVQLLIDAKAHIHINDSEGRTAL